DPSQVEHLNGFQGKAIRDSGAYAMHRAGVPDYGERVAEFHRDVVKDMREHDFECVIALDVFGDHERTRLNYVELSQRLARMWSIAIPYTPVWHWGAPVEYLEAYLDHAEVVGIGGLVTLMREKDERMLDGLVELCWQHPGRFHIFGCNWPKAITELRPYAALPTRHCGSATHATGWPYSSTPVTAG
ncbi:MAG: hypothetical protein JXA93_06340, partial [Anaerolineae bacterium]|nr:hypothetical protein [Anaerolineae bacterium]